MKVIETSTKIERIGFKQLRDDSDAIIAAVQKGQSFVVGRHSKDLFRIVPMQEEVWETIVDFTEIQPNGIPAEDVLSALNKLKNR
jgi:antitoxin (DNA-binding transcriptional repressor) of toxin-antitoxin stability system